jgi:hypothetical protein
VTEFGVSSEDHFRVSDKNVKKRELTQSAAPLHKEELTI